MTRRQALLAVAGALAVGVRATGPGAVAEEAPEEQLQNLPPQMLKAKRFSVEYRVPTHFPGWTAARLFQNRVLDNKTVEGWLVGGSPFYVVLATEMRFDQTTGEVEFMDARAIPVGAIVRVEEK